MDRIEACCENHHTPDVDTDVAVEVTIDDYVVDELRSFPILHSSQFLFVADSYFAFTGDNHSINSGHLLVAPLADEVVGAENFALFDKSWFV